MPFTLAHPLAALPLARPLGRYGVVSALVIGSMAPDFWYFLPVGVTREEAHSYDGILWFCLPAALAAYLVFHLLLKRPLLALAPHSIGTRLAPYARTTLPQASWLAVLVSFMVGMATHLAWDAFTHFDSVVADLAPALRGELLSIGRYDVHGFTVLQHGSSLLGMAALGAWAGTWLRRAKPEPLRLPFDLGAAGKAVAVTGLLVAMAWGGVSLLVEVEPQTAREALFTTRTMVRSTLAGAGAGFFCGLLAYSLLWHALAWRVRRAF
jgi:hypothetical protein